jgi:hypothetical protein
MMNRSNSIGSISTFACTSPTRFVPERFSKQHIVSIMGSSGKREKIACYCLLRFPGQNLAVGGSVDGAVLQWVSCQLEVDAACWPGYFSRETTRREHLLELRSYLCFRAFGLNDYRLSKRD